MRKFDYFKQVEGEVIDIHVMCRKKVWKKVETNRCLNKSLKIHKFYVKFTIRQFLPYSTFARLELTPYSRQIKLSSCSIILTIFSGRMLLSFPFMSILSPFYCFNIESCHLFSCRSNLALKLRIFLLNQGETTSIGLKVKTCQSIFCFSYSLSLLSYSLFD